MAIAPKARAPSSATTSQARMVRIRFILRDLEPWRVSETSSYQPFASAVMDCERSSYVAPKLVTSLDKMQSATCGIVCESRGSVNWRKGTLPSPQDHLERTNSLRKCRQRTKTSSRGALHAARFLISPRFLFTRLGHRCFRGSPSRPRKGRFATPQDTRGIAKGHERRGRKKPRYGDGNRARLKRPTGVVRWNR